MSNFLQKTYIYGISKRFFKRKRYLWPNEGIKYPGFTFYPRSPDFQDPPYEPSKLFRVQRIKPLKGVPYYEKNILKQLKLDGRSSEIAILKNIPEINELLWKIKHLIQIKPVTFPNGFPQNVNGTYLKENGEMIVKKEIIPEERKLIATDNFKTDPRKLDGDTLRRYLRKKWLDGW